MAVAQSVLARRYPCRVPQVPLYHGVLALPDFAATPVLDVYRLRPSCPPHGGNDLPQVLYVAASVVLCDVPDDKHAMWNLREAVGAGAWCYLQDGLAHGVPHSQQADDTRRRPTRQWESG